MDKKFNFQELQAIVATLRGENGCPWDKSQTHESLKLYTLEEAYEVNQAVTDLTKTGDCANLKEELGDLLFQVLLQSQVAEDNGEFAIEDVIDGIARKMIHRHPHVFAGRHYDSVEQQQNRHNAKRTSPSFSDNSSSLLNFFSGSSPAVPSCKFTTEVSRSLKTSSSSVENSPAAAAFFAIFWPRMRAGKLSGTRAISSFKEVCLCPSS